MTKFATITAFAVFLMLGGCQSNGTYDFSNLLKPGERIIISKESDNPKTDNADEDQQNVEKNYYYAVTSTRNGTKTGHYFLPDEDGLTHFQDLRKEKLDIDKQNRSSSRVEVDGELGLFIEFNTGREWIKTSGFKKETGREFYIVSGGSLSNAGTWDDVNWRKNSIRSEDKFDSYTPMPTGVLGYNGNVVMAKTVAFTGFDVGTVEAEVDFNNNSMWIEFEGVGISHRFNDFELDIETGYFEDELHSGNSSVYGYLIGQKAKGMEGNVWWEDSRSENRYRTGVFVAERSDTPVVAAN